MRLMYWLVLLVAAALLFVSVWILIPAPNVPLLLLGVGAPEFSPLLLCLGLALVAVCGLRARTLGTARLGLVCSLVATALAALPLVQLPYALKRFDAAIAGTEAQGRPVVFRDLFQPPAPPAARIIRKVQFAEHDGVPLALDIYRPVSAAGRTPVLVQVYGGAWQRGAPADDEWFARYFASRGYLVLAVDYRHAPQWKWPAQLDDIQSALRWTAANAGEFGGDPGRIIVVGRSSGAQLGLTAAYLDASPAIKAVVSYYGPVDLEDGWRHPPQPDPLKVRGLLETYLGGTPDEQPARYQAASPITYASRKQPPTLLIYGSRDHIVEARFGRQLDAALKKAGNVSVLLELPWSEHAFDLLPNGLGGQISRYYAERFMAWALSR